jgi:hypothetical protein
MLKRLLFLVVAFGASAGAAEAKDETVRLWPGAAPGTEDWDAQERTFEIPTKESGILQLVTDVAVPIGGRKDRGLPFPRTRVRTSDDRAPGPGRLASPAPRRAQR